MNKPNSKNLDIEAFRAYAISITIVAHFGTIVPEWDSEWISFFWLGGGVDLFFCISGYLITRSLLDSLNKNYSFWCYARIFWLRRIFRLWPAALFWSTSALIISSIFDVERSFGNQEMVFNSWLYGVLNLENFYIYDCFNTNPLCAGTPLWHYWSLSLEEQYYLLLPFILYFTPFRKHLIWVFFAIAVKQAVSIRPWGELLWFVRSDALLYGTMIAIGWHYYSETLNSVFHHVPKWLWRILITALSIALIIVARDLVSVHYHGLVAATAGVMVLIISMDLDLITKWDASKLLAEYIGSRSYSIYLVHLPVFAIAREVSLNTEMLDLSQTYDQVLAVILGLAFTFLLAEFSFKAIESPLRRVGRQLAIRDAKEKKTLAAV